MCGVARKVIHRPEDELLPGAPPLRVVGGGAQLYLRTSTHSYTAYLATPCSCIGGLLLLDETIYDVRADPEERQNLAYRVEHAGVRARLFALMVRSWNVTLQGPTAADRPARLALIDTLLRCRTNTNTSLRACAHLGMVRSILACP